MSSIEKADPRDTARGSNQKVIEEFLESGLETARIKGVPKGKLVSKRNSIRLTIGASERYKKSVRVSKAGDSLYLERIGE